MENCYTMPIALTQQFRHCPNAFRIDLYKGCDFGCKYCFANNTFRKDHDNILTANIREIERKFEIAFETDRESKDIIIDLLRHKVPLHCGGLADPFQPIEFKEELTYSFIKLSCKYNYPVTFSTKTAKIPKKYLDALNPKIHAFQISLCGYDDSYIRAIESSTPSAHDRIDFIKNLSNYGFWVGVRIQPIIDINQAILLINNLMDIPDYYTVEHLHININKIDAQKELLQNSNIIDWTQFVKVNQEFQVKRYIREKNIKKIKEAANKYGVLVGVGDNDLHNLSQSKCCCGIDLINNNFKNYLRYNKMCIESGEYKKGDYIPDKNLRSFMIQKISTKENSFIDYKTMVDRYMSKTKENHKLF